MPEKYPSFTDFIDRELVTAYHEAIKGKRKTHDASTYELNYIANNINLRNAMLSRTYRPSKGIAFVIADPVVREIVAAKFRDRVIHHFIFNIIAGWWDRRLANDSYSCRKQKGTLYGQKRLQKHLRRVRSQSGERVFVAKFDLTGYFMSLNHKMLYELTLKGLKQQFFGNGKVELDDEYDRKNDIRCAPKDRVKLYKLLRFLLRVVIFDKPMQDIIKRGKPTDWDKLPRSKRLECQPSGQGIVIGNLTSQLLSNIYLDQMDRYIMFDLGYKAYGRYVDDFFIAVPWSQKDQLIKDTEKIESYLKDQLKLKLHPKKRLFQAADEGIPFLGGIVRPDYIVPGKRWRKNFKKALKAYVEHNNGDLEGIIARIGSVAHISSQTSVKRLFDQAGWPLKWQPGQDYKVLITELRQNKPPKTQKTPHKECFRDESRGTTQEQET